MIKKKNLYIGFVDLEKAFDRVPKKVMEWANRKKKVAEVMAKAVMSLYDGAKTKVMVASGLSDEFSVNVGAHQGSVLSEMGIYRNNLSAIVKAIIYYRLSLSLKIV